MAYYPWVPARPDEAAPTELIAKIVARLGTQPPPAGPAPLTGINPVCNALSPSKFIYFWLNCFYDLCLFAFASLSLDFYAHLFLCTIPISQLFILSLWLHSPRAQADKQRLQEEQQRAEEKQRLAYQALVSSRFLVIILSLH